MRIGIPTLVEYDSVKENAELCKKYGLDFIELNMDLPYCYPENLDLKSIREEYNLDFTIHLSEKIDVADSYCPVRKFNLNLIKQFIDWGEINGIKKYNVHLDRGVYFTLSKKKLYIYEKYKEKYEKDINDSFKELSDYAVKNDVYICFENTKMTDYIMRSFKELANYPNLCCTLDVGHDAKNGNYANELFLNNPTLKHMHLHDYNGTKNHEELGTGTVDIGYYLNYCLEHDLDVVIEVKEVPELESSIKYIKDVCKIEKIGESGWKKN